jgi:hypothetical protein
MTIVILGIDLGKNSCSVAGLDESGAVVLRRRMRRPTILGFAAKLPACVVGGVLRGSLSGASADGPGPHGKAHVTGICAALRQSAEER